MCTGAHSLVGYIRDDESKHNWLRERTLRWEKNITTIRNIAGKYPQEIYATVLCAIQSEWVFLKHVTCETGDAFVGVDKMIRETCLTCLFFENMKTLSPS